MDVGGKIKKVPVSTIQSCGTYDGHWGILSDIGSKGQGHASHEICEAQLLLLLFAER
jgi:hypothetical protein